MKSLIDMDQDVTVRSVLDNLKNLEDVIPNVNIEELKAWPLDKLHIFIQDARFALPNRAVATIPDQFGRIDSVLIPLRKIMRGLDIGPIESHSISPASYDVMLTDIAPSDIKGPISDILKIEYLSVVPSDTPPRWPLQGILFGARRIMVSVVVSCHRLGQIKSRNVHFIFDTCSPETYLTREAFAALGVDDPDIDGTPTYRVNGQRMHLGVSHGKFEEVNLLGMNFLDRASASVKISYLPLDTEGHRVLFEKCQED